MFGFSWLKIQPEANTETTKNGAFSNPFEIE